MTSDLVRRVQAAWRCAYEGATENPYAEGSDEWEAFNDGIIARGNALKRKARAKPRKKDVERRIAVMDFETDPFGMDDSGKELNKGRSVWPFLWVWYDGETLKECWDNENCVQSFVDFVSTLEHHYIIYAHNGGHFDYMFLTKYFVGPLFCINSRIVRAHLASRVLFDHNGQAQLQELRDSFAIIPEALADAAQKHKFDYKNMASGRRERHRKEIIEYARQDVLETYRIVKEHRAMFGDTLTMAQAAMSKLNEAMAPLGHPNISKFRVHDQLSPSMDAILREWYFGGRVECFERGILTPSNGAREFRIYDVNSMYASVMRNVRHPVGNQWSITRDITANTDFALIDATSNGALPMREPSGGLRFHRGRAIYNASIHEINAGIDTGTLIIHRVLHARECKRKTDFRSFIDKYYALRLEAKEHKKLAIDDGNIDRELYWDVMQLFFKRVMNGAYGKYAQNPREFKDYELRQPGEEPPSAAHGWRLEYVTPIVHIYSRRTEAMFPGSAARSYLNVATAASITGAARARLLRGLVNSTRAVYCDTDSIVCESLTDDIDPDQLGAFKLEKTAHTLAIAEKKLYCAMGEVSNNAEENARRIKEWGDAACVKLASKGVRLHAPDIFAIARGETIEHAIKAPKIKMDGRQVFTTRRIRMNAR